MPITHPTNQPRKKIWIWPLLVVVTLVVGLVCIGAVNVQTIAFPTILGNLLAAAVLLVKALGGGWNGHDLNKVARIVPIETKPVAVLK